MARSMACELGLKGIRVNSLSPGHIYTKFVLVWQLEITHAYLQDDGGIFGYATAPTRKMVGSESYGPHWPIR